MKLIGGITQMNINTDNILPIRPKPYHLETMEGFFIRTAEKNGYDSATYVTDNFVDIFKIDSHNTHDGRLPSKLTNEFKSRLNLSDEELNIINYPKPPIKSFDSLLDIGAGKINRNDLKFGNTSICPYCINEHGYISRLWEIITYTVCPQHQCRLISQCHNCSSKLSPRRGVLCHCDVDIADDAIPKIPKEECEFTEIIKAKVEGKEVSTYLKDKYQPLINLNLSEMLTAFRTMAWFNSAERDPWHPKKYSINKDIHSVIVSTLQKFEDWPNNWIKYLNESNEFLSSIEKISLKSRYKKEFTTFFNCDEILNFMKDAFNAWLIEKHPIVGAREDLKKLVNTTQQQQRYITVSDAARLLGVTRNTIFQWGERGYLKVRHDVDGCNEKFLVNKKSAISLADKRKKSLSKKAASKYLKTTPRALDTLTKANVIKATKEDFPDYVFYRLDEIESLIKKIEDSVTQLPSRDTINMTAALSMTSDIWPGIGPIIHGIIHNKIRISHYNKEKGLTSIRLSKSDLTIHLKEIIGKNGKWHTRDDVAEILAVPKSFASKLLKSRLLKSEDLCPDRHSKRRKVLHEDIDKLNEKYISIYEIERLSGKSKDYLHSEFYKLNILPVKQLNGYGVSGLYLRSVIDSFLKNRNYNLRE